MTKKKLISTKMKITMASLFIGSIISFGIAGTTLYNSNYKLSNYFDVNKIEFGFFYNSNGPIGNLISLTNQDITNIENINLEFHSNISFIETYTGNSIEILTYSIDNLSNFDNITTVNVSNDNNTLTITPNDTIDKSTSLQYKIRIPNTYTNNLNLSSSTGKIDLSSIKLNSLNLNSSDDTLYNSAIKLNGVTCKNSNINIKNSQLYTKNFTTNDLSIECIDSYINTSALSGNVSINAISSDVNTIATNELSNLTVSNNSGDINIHLPSDGNFAVNSSVINGHFYNYLDNNDNYTEPTQTAYPVELGTGTNKIKLDTINGSIRLNK